MKWNCKALVDYTGSPPKERGSCPANDSGKIAYRSRSNDILQSSELNRW